MLNWLKQLFNKKPSSSVVKPLSREQWRVVPSMPPVRLHEHGRVIKRTVMEDDDDFLTAVVVASLVQDSYSPSYSYFDSSSSSDSSSIDCSSSSSSDSGSCGSFD